MTRYHLDASAPPPVDAYVTLGRKGGNGAPTDKDVFWITSPDMVTREFKARNGKTFKGDVHPLHPALTAWHNEATKDERRTLTIELESATVHDALRVGRARAKDPQGREAPNKAPWCAADHTGTARVYRGTWQTRQCARDACPDAQGCKPSVAIYGRIVWEGRWAHLPSLAIRLRSRGWDAAKGVMGFVEQLDKAWAAAMVHASGRYDLQDQDWHAVRAEAGLPDFIATGLRVRLQLFEATRDGGRKRYWGIRVHSVTPVAAWLDDQRQRVQLARSLRTETTDPGVIVEPELSTDDGLNETQRTAVAYLERRGVTVADASGWVGGLPPSQWGRDELDTIKGRLQAAGGAK